MRAFLACLLALASSVACALPANVEFVETLGGISQYRLKSNGMPILLHVDRSAPVVTFMVVYHVGSRNEAPGNTGSAHLLEHMIFNKSTTNFGKANGHKTFQEVLYEAGADAGSSNMTTWYDRMNGYSTVPAGKLELAMRIEADRMQRALILDSERQSEMSVVRNEYEIGENSPPRVLNQATVAAAIQAHPYHWSTIGYRSDIEGVSTEQLRAHYKAFFHPDNSEAIVVGDFDPEAALALFDAQFGGFPRAAAPIPKVITVEPPQQGERRTVVSRPGTVGMVMLGYIRPGVMHPDFDVLEVLGQVLAEGVNSRLHQALVETRIATAVEVDNSALRDPYPILLTATLPGAGGHEEAERAMKAVVDKVVREGITEEELARAKSQIAVAEIRSREGTYNFASNLGEAVASARWQRFVTFGADVKKITTADVQRVAKSYLLPERATVGWFVPLAGDAPRAAPIPVAPMPTRARVTGDEATKPIAATSAPFATRTVHQVLPNGIVVDVVRNAASPTVAIRAIVLSGDASAPAGQPALPAFTAKMLARGTAKRSKEEIGRLLDGAGATRTYATTLGETVITAGGLSKDLPLLLEVLGEEMTQPAFAAAEIEKARQDLQTDYLRADDNTQARALERLSQLVYAQSHPYYSAGRERKVASVRAVTEADLRAFHRERFTGANLVIAIVGDVDPAKAIAMVRERMGSLPAGRRLDFSKVARTSAPQQGKRELLRMPGKANMNLVLGTASGLRRTDADYEAALVANAALGQSALSSRIGRRVRDTEGLTYQIYSRFGFSEELDGLWFVNVNVAPQNLAKALKSTREELDKYSREGATDAEVETQKSFFAGNYQVNLGSNAGVASALVNAERYGFGPAYLDEFPGRIRAVTATQANAAMHKYFFADRLNLIVAGDAPALPE